VNYCISFTDSVCDGGYCGLRFFDFLPNAPASPTVPGFGLTSSPVYVGYENLTYQLNFVLPPVPVGVPACDGVKIQSNVTVTVSGPNSYDVAQLYAAPN
jgi:hypothetical protein